MVHDCVHEEEFRVFRDDFREVFGKVNETHTTVKLLDQAIRGNGQPGINQRLSTVETEVRNLRETKIALYATFGVVGLLASGIGSVITFFVVKGIGG